jgi:hypothetical protein
MDVSSIASLATDMQASSLRDKVGTAVLKLAMDTKAQAALALIQAIPQPPAQSSANLPPNLGQNIDTTA